MALRPFEESKQMFKKNKDQHTEREKPLELKE
jgi:hypothetical protein